MQLFAVHCSQEGFISTWRNYDDAYAAACEAYAMDPESYYSVETIEEEELHEFWFHNPQLDLA
jgi:hypothetical protein